MDHKKKVLEDLRSVQADMARVAERRRPSQVFPAVSCSGGVGRPDQASPPPSTGSTDEASQPDPTERAAPAQSERVPASSSRYAIISPRIRRKP